MSLTLHYHPLASFCWKVLIALYESETPFAPHLVDLSDPVARAELERLWPVGKFPVLRDEANGRAVPESSIIIEYLAQHHPGAAELVPSDPDGARETRLRDRFFDLYVQAQMQKIVGDRLRPAEERDPRGVADARAQLQVAYAMIERDMTAHTWAMGPRFTMADCAAMPALYYGNEVCPLGEDHPRTSAYLARLLAHPSCARVIREAEPYFAQFPR